MKFFKKKNKIHKLKVITLQKDYILIQRMKKVKNNKKTFNSYMNNSLLKISEKNKQKKIEA